MQNTANHIQKEPTHLFRNNSILENVSFKHGQVLFLILAFFYYLLIMSHAPLYRIFLYRVFLYRVFLYRTF